MDAKEIKATLLTKKSSQGKEYLCIELVLTEDYTKRVFLDTAEQALIKRELKLDAIEKPTTFPFSE